MSSTPGPDAPSPRYPILHAPRRITYSYSRESLLSLRLLTSEKAYRHKLQAGIDACKREIEAESEPPPAAGSEPPPTSPGSKSNKICTRFFRAGDCRFGDGCCFVHHVPSGHHEADQAVTKKMNILDLRGNLAQAPAPMSASPATVKTRLCKNHDTPEGCKWGDRCHFAHGKDQLGKPMGPGSSFKTRLCVSFVAAGSCAFAGRCHFAHGKDELRTSDAC